MILSFNLCILVSFWISLWYVVLTSATHSSSFHLHSLRVNGLDYPLTITPSKHPWYEPPLLSWKVDFGNGTYKRGIEQSAYRINLYEKNHTHEKAYSMLWDSHKTMHEHRKFKPAVQVPENVILKEDTQYKWTLEVWTTEDDNEPLINENTFETGLTTPWTHSKWIAGKTREHNQIRTEFRVHKGENVKVTHAKLYIVGLGYYRVEMNGVIVSEHKLGAFTTWEQRVLYNAFDVTNVLKENNAIGVSLGNGWYAQKSVNAGEKCMRAQISIYLSNGDHIVVGSDLKWTAKDGPVRSDDIYAGEVYDATKETPGWTLPDYEHDWISVIEVAGPAGTLYGELMQHVQETVSFPAISVLKTAPGVYTFDMGQNLAGYVRLRVSGDVAISGQTITMRHDELVYSSGEVQHLYPNVAGLACYTMRGDGSDEVYSPIFTYFGFRFVEVTGYPGEPPPEALEAIFVHTNLPLIGSITFSSSLLEKIQHATRYSALSNYVSIPTDCPQRERRGWLADAHLASETNIYNFDMFAAYNKFLNDIADSQLWTTVNEHGNWSLPDCAPFYNHGFEPADPAWAAAYAIILYNMWYYYGDEYVVRRHLKNVNSYVESITPEVHRANGIHDRSYFGDWCSAAKGPACFYESKFISTFYYILQRQILAELSVVIDETADVSVHNLEVELSKKALHKHFYDNSGAYRDGSVSIQTTNTLALFLGLVPYTEERAVVDALLNDIERYGCHSVAGIVGAKYLLPLLTNLGYGNVALDIAMKNTSPSMGFMIEQGATTLWETFFGDEFTAVGSRNHIMFGSQSHWYFSHLAGIQMPKGVYAFSKLYIKPYINESYLSFVDASIMTVRGRVSSIWQSHIPKLCGIANQNKLVTLQCVGGIGNITSIDFASFGNPLGDCGSFQKGQCHASVSQQVVEEQCLGKSSCSIQASTSAFGRRDPCVGQQKRLAIQASGCHAPYLSYYVEIPIGVQAVIELPLLDGSASDIAVVDEHYGLIWHRGAASAIPGVISVHVSTSTITLELLSGQYSLVLAMSSSSTAHETGSNVLPGSQKPPKIAIR